MTTTNGLNVKEQAQLVQALQDRHCYPHPVTTVEVIETHISFVLLAGEFVYKIKKSVNFGFLDFSTLALRRHCCEEELRLNRRQAADLYLEVVAITGSATAPHLDGVGETIEFAVKMRRFAQSSLLDQRLTAGQITARHIDRLAHTLADFHDTVARTNNDSPYGDLDQIAAYTLENCRVVAPLLPSAKEINTLDAYKTWIGHQHATLAARFAERKSAGFVRECHGDLHVRNITVDDDTMHFFDCIEFNPALRWVDVMSELAFLAMDLDACSQPAFSHRLLNTYLETTGDYAGVRLLPYYLAYRAMVRAKVALLRLPQAKPNEQPALHAQAAHYVTLAWRYASRRIPAVILTHGLSGSGKSTHTQTLIEALGALRLRSDVERKRLFGLPRKRHEDAAVNSDLYSADATQRTYAHLVQQATCVVETGWPVIIDATSLKRWQRDIFRDLAQTQRIPFVLVDFAVDTIELERRIEQRRADGNDASDATIAVLHQQLATCEPLAPEERADVFAFPATGNADTGTTAWQPLLEKLHHLGRRLA